MCEDSFHNTFTIQINEQSEEKKKEESILGITIHPIFPSLSVFLFKNPMLPFSVRTANQIFFFFKEKKKSCSVSGLTWFISEVRLFDKE